MQIQGAAAAIRNRPRICPPEDLVSGVLRRLEDDLQETLDSLNGVLRGGAAAGNVDLAYVHFVVKRESQRVEACRYLLRALGACFDDSRWREPIFTSRAPPDANATDSVSTAAADTRASWSKLEQTALLISHDLTKRLSGLEESHAIEDYDTRAAELRSNEVRVLDAAHRAVRELSNFFPRVSQQQDGTHGDSIFAHRGLVSIEGSVSNNGESCSLHMSRLPF